MMDTNVKVFCQCVLCLLQLEEKNSNRKTCEIFIKVNNMLNAKNNDMPKDYNLESECDFSNEYIICFSDFHSVSFSFVVYGVLPQF